MTRPLIARRRRSAPAAGLFVVAALLLAACGGSDAPVSLEHLVLGSEDVPARFSQPELVPEFPLPIPLGAAVADAFFVSLSDSDDQGAFEQFLMSGAARIVRSELVEEFFDDADIFLLQVVADSGLDPDEARIERLSGLADRAALLTYMPVPGGQQQILVLRVGSWLGYVAIFRPPDLQDALDIEALAAVVVARLAAESP